MGKWAVFAMGKISAILRAETFYIIAKTQSVLHHQILLNLFVKGIAWGISAFFQATRKGNLLSLPYQGNSSKFRLPVTNFTKKYQ